MLPLEIIVFLQHPTPEFEFSPSVFGTPRQALTNLMISENKKVDHLGSSQIRLVFSLTIRKGVRMRGKEH